MNEARMNKKDLHDFYTRDANGKLHLNAKSVFIGGYDPEQTNKIIEEMTVYYQDIIVDLLEQIRQKDEQIYELSGKNKA